MRRGAQPKAETSVPFVMLMGYLEPWKHNPLPTASQAHSLFLDSLMSLRLMATHTPFGLPYSLWLM